MSLYCVVRESDGEVVGASALNFHCALSDAAGNVKGTMDLQILANHTTHPEAGLERGGYRLEQKPLAAAHGGNAAVLSEKVRAFMQHNAERLRASAVRCTAGAAQARIDMIGHGIADDLERTAAHSADLVQELERALRSSGKDCAWPDEKMLPNYSAHVGFSRDDIAFVATCHELPGLSGIGRTRHEAMRELLRASIVAVQAIVDNGEALPLQLLKPEPSALRPAGGVEVMAVDDVRQYDREAIREALANAIGDSAYDCTRVWSAWGYGTMTEDDFVSLADSADRLEEIVDAITAALGGPT